MSGFLFDSDFTTAGRRYSLIRPETGRELKFEFSSDLVLHYAIHFAGKAFLCPGEESCPACGTLGKRVLSMIFTGNEQHVGMLEVGLSTMSQLQCIARDNSILNLSGTRWSFLRRLARRPLIPVLSGIAPLPDRSSVSTVAALSGFAKIFGMPMPFDYETPDVFAARAREGLCKKLSEYLLH